MPSSRCCFSTGSRRLLILLSLVSLGKPYWLSIFPVHNSSFCEAPHALPYTSACLVPPSSSFSVFSSRQCSDVVWSVPLPFPYFLSLTQNPSNVVLPIGFPPCVYFLSSCDYSSSTVASVSVAPTILTLLSPERDHHWCIPFTVTGNPKPELRWYHNNKPLQEQDYIRTMIHVTTENQQHGCLQLVNPTHIHNGEYKLVAENKYGRDEKNISAQFLHPPNINHTGQYSVFSHESVYWSQLVSVYYGCWHAFFFFSFLFFSTEDPEYCKYRFGLSGQMLYLLARWWLSANLKWTFIMSLSLSCRCLCLHLLPRRCVFQLSNLHEPNSQHFGMLSLTRCYWFKMFRPMFFFQILQTLHRMTVLL